MHLLKTRGKRSARGEKQERRKGRAWGQSDQPSSSSTVTCVLLQLLTACSRSGLQRPVKAEEIADKGCNARLSSHMGRNKAAESAVALVPSVRR